MRTFARRSTAALLCACLLSASCPAGAAPLRGGANLPARVVPFILAQPLVPQALKLRLDSLKTSPGTFLQDLRLQASLVPTGAAEAARAESAKLVLRLLSDPALLSANRPELFSVLGADGLAALEGAVSALALSPSTPDASVLDALYSGRRLGASIDGALAGTPGSISARLHGLEQKHAGSKDAARRLAGNPERLSGVERFAIVFTNASWSPEETVGRDLLVLETQTQIAEAYLKDPPRDLSPPKDGWFSHLGLGAAKLAMRLSCGFSPACGRAVGDLLETLDLRDVHDGFSGLPYFSLVEAKFRDPVFRSRVVSFAASLERLAASSDDPAFKNDTDLFRLATGLCGGDQAQAVELLAILTSRDALITRYLKYLRSDDAAFVRAFARAPLLIRLVADLERSAPGPFRDRFSYPEGYAAPTPRNYYFWSSAYLALKLKQAGHPDALVSRLTLMIPKAYKLLRYLASLGPLRPRAWREERRRDRELVLSLSRAGAAHGLAVAGSTPSADADFEAFVQALVEPPSLRRREKVDLLRAISRGEPSTRGSVYLLYYDLRSDLIGYPHFKLIVDGRVYEIHRVPNVAGGHLRDRTLAVGLRDARRGWLPSGILEIPAGEDQKARIKGFLAANSGPGMKYAFFNALFAPGHHSCGGFIYEALRAAGLGLPALSRLQALPGQMFRAARAALPGSRLIGRGGRWTDELVLPHWSLESIPRPLSSRLGGSNAFFAPVVGPEFLNAEQKLVDALPLMADPINTLGRVLSVYGNYGKLKEEYRPTSSPTLRLTALLIPEKDLSLAAGEPSPELVASIDASGGRVLRFFIHPNELERYKDLVAKYPQDGVEWLATPTSSARSLVVQDKERRFPPFALKLSLSVPMGGSSRLIEEESAARAVKVSALIGEIHGKTGGRLPGGKTWSFMPEPFSMMPADERLGGLILRRLPEDMAGDVLLPVFSLIASRKPKGRWLDILYSASGKADMASFVWEDLVRPMLELHALLSFDNGLTTELHQQNLLVVVDRATKKVKGLMLRDMDGHWVDHSLRVHRLGKPAVSTTAGWDRDAYLLRYAYAPGNHAVGYVDMLRARNIENTFKYALGRGELQDLLAKSDAHLLGLFNARFPEADVESMEDYAAAWKAISAAATTASEARAYARLRAGIKEKSVSRWHRWLDAWYQWRLKRGLRRSDERRRRGN